jgi:hypothetical protein
MIRRLLIVLAWPALVSGMAVSPVWATSRASANQMSAQTEQRDVYVTGYVAKPGTYAFEERMTVQDVVQRAEGFTRAAPHQ